jgi:hypothetical protein
MSQMNAPLDYLNAMERLNMEHHFKNAFHLQQQQQQQQNIINNQINKQNNTNNTNKQSSSSSNNNNNNNNNSNNHQPPHLPPHLANFDPSNLLNNPNLPPNLLATLQNQFAAVAAAAGLTPQQLQQSAQQQQQVSQQQHQQQQQNQPFLNMSPFNQLDPFLLASRERDLAAQTQHLLRRQPNLDPNIALALAASQFPRPGEELQRLVALERERSQQSDELRRLSLLAQERERFQMMAANNGGTHNEDLYRYKLN